MKINDAHTHIFPDKIADKATENICKFYDLNRYSTAAVNALEESGKKIDVQHFLVCSSALAKDQSESINDFISLACKKNPKFVGLGAVHRDMNGYEEELDRIVSLGLKGIKIHSDFQQINIDDEKMIPIYKAIAKRKLPILFHMGDARYDYSAPKRLYNVCDQVPDLVVIGAHFGGYSRWDEAYNMPVLDNVYFDTSSSLAFLEPEKARKMIEKFGVKHFMFGTDFPLWNPKDELERFLKIGLSDKDNEDILYNNFMELFNL